MPWSLLFYLGAVLLLCTVGPASATQCFEWPEGTDYAPFLTTAVTKTTKDPVEAWPAEADLRPLFDKSGDVQTGTRLDMSNSSQKLQVELIIPTTLPQLGKIQITGSGHLTLTLICRYENDLEKQLVLDDVTGYVVTVDVYPTYEAVTVKVGGTAFADSYISDLQLLASSAPSSVQEDDFYETSDDDTDQDQWLQDDQPIQGDWGPTGCACLGFPDTNSPGGSCGEWDNDCKGTGGWCYVRLGACADQHISGSYANTAWSCLPCMNSSTAANATNATKPSNSTGPPKKKKASKPPSSKCPECSTGGPLVMGLFGGLALGVTGMVFMYQTRRPQARTVRRVDHGSDDELGHND